MEHPLTRKCLALVILKGAVVGYAQWTGTITLPVSPAVPLQTTGMGVTVILPRDGLGLPQE
jgi:uncharacterized membrane protein